MNKDNLYATINLKLDHYSKDDFIKEGNRFAKGMAIGCLYGIIGTYYEYELISTGEYLELCSTVEKAINNMKEVQNNEYANAE